jgi:hypothetical protein
LRAGRQTAVVVVDAARGSGHRLRGDGGGHATDKA